MPQSSTYKNQFNRDKYDRIGLMLPKGQGDIWRAEAERRNLSLNAFIKECVNEKLDNKENLSNPIV